MCRFLTMWEVSTLNPYILQRATVCRIEEREWFSSMRFPWLWIMYPISQPSSTSIHWAALRSSKHASGNHLHPIHSRNFCAHSSLVAAGDAMTKLKKGTSNYGMLTRQFPALSLPTHKSTWHHSVIVAFFHCCWPTPPHCNHNYDSWQYLLKVYIFILFHFFMETFTCASVLEFCYSQWSWRPV